jgi:hypothetical protein
VFSSNITKPHLSFAAALRGQADQLNRKTVASTSEHESPNTKTKSTQQEAVKSVPHPTVYSDPLDVFRALTAVEQIRAELKGAVAEEAKILDITKIVFNLMKQNGKYSS